MEIKVHHPHIGVKEGVCGGQMSTLCDRGKHEPRGKAIGVSFQFLQVPYSAMSPDMT